MIWTKRERTNDAPCEDGSVFVDLDGHLSRTASRLVAGAPGRTD